MTKIRNWAMKMSMAIPALALFAGVASLNSACLVIFHQPEVSSDLNEYRK